jgi:peptide chain release factor 1
MGVAILEFRGAVGGEEANLFALDLMQMYRTMAAKKGWKAEVLDLETTTKGGCKYGALRLEGDGVEKLIETESGGHRVQRVPATEAHGRIQTSIATVYAMAPAKESEIKIDKSKVRMDTYHSQGAGGQNVNKTESAVRLTYGDVVVSCQVSRDQLKNRQMAWEMLYAKLAERQRAESEGKAAASRRSAVGTGDRAEKIRTYNYPRDQVVDERTKRKANLTKVMQKGQVDLLWK